MPDFDIVSIIRTVSVAAIPVLFAITLHEVAHGWAARAYGDRTAEMLGRLSINPLRHVDPVGTIAVPILIFLLSAGSFLFGWAKPVPVSTSGLRNPKRDMVMVAAAGPAMNLVMASFWTLVLALSMRLGEGTLVADFLNAMAQIGIFFNVLLAVFNLLPLPPLDGGRVLRGLVPESIGRRLDAIEPFGLIIVVLLLTAGVIGPVMWPLISSLQGFMFRIASVLGG